ERSGEGLRGIDNVVKDSQESEEHWCFEQLILQHKTSTVIKHTSEEHHAHYLRKRRSQVPAITDPVLRMKQFSVSRKKPFAEQPFNVECFNNAESAQCLVERGKRFAVLVRNILRMALQRFRNPAYHKPKDGDEKKDE